jgi:hypothetical protein
VTEKRREANGEDGETVGPWMVCKVTGESKVSSVSVGMRVGMRVGRAEWYGYLGGCASGVLPRIRPSFFLLDEDHLESCATARAY